MSDDTVMSVKHFRPPQDNIPQTKQMRDRILQTIRDYVQREKPVGPLSLEELKAHTKAIVKLAEVDEKYSNYILILINNEVWRDTVAGIPYEKRLFLLAKCLRHDKECPAEFDDLGLLCQHCGRCVIDELKRQAEELGYAVLIAEGSPVVMSLIETGKIEAIIGISCMSVLEEVFPYMEAGAVPGMAIPLLQDGCANTSVDVDWVLDALYLTTEDKVRRLNLEALHNQVDNYFNTESLFETFKGKTDDMTQRLAIEWLSKAGKRWRPFLAVCTYNALKKDNETISEQDLKNAAIAVECFHKASLIHDDIEDDDTTRYDQKTLHAEYGIPIALNVGDYLLGEGYRLLAELDIPEIQRAKLIQTAAEGHRSLCLGQGKELSWLHDRKALSKNDVLEIFSLKTAPAFEVALKIGAIIADCDKDINEVLKSYSVSLGIAYQIQDDLNDLISEPNYNFNLCNRPSILLSMAHDMTSGKNKEIIESAWKGSVKSQADMKPVLDIFNEIGIEKNAMLLNEFYKSKAIDSLIPLKNINLKSLLRRVISKIFKDFDNMECCDDYQNRNASGGEKG